MTDELEFDAREDDRAMRIDEAVHDAAALGDDGRWDEARVRLSDALEDDGDDAKLLCWLALANERDGAAGEAYEYARRCLALEPSDPFTLATVGSILAQSDDPDAERVLRLAALSAPDFAYARQAYGAYLVREGLTDEALRELEAARALDPHDAGPLLETAVAHLGESRWAPAIAALEEAHALASEDSWLHMLLGLALVVEGDTERAAETLHAACAERPLDCELHLAYALAAAAAGWEDEAWRAMELARDAATAADQGVIGEVEDVLSEDAENAEQFLRDELTPALLRERLRDRG